MESGRTTIWIEPSQRQDIHRIIEKSPYLGMKEFSFNASGNSEDIEFSVVSSEQLKHLTFAYCHFSCGVALPLKLERLVFIECAFGDIAPRLILNLADLPLKILKIKTEEKKESSKVYDTFFRSFPQTLERFVLIGGDEITDATIMKLPITLKKLRIADCPKITMTRGRAQQRFKQCEEINIKGFSPGRLARVKEELEERVMGQPYATKKAYELCCVFNTKITESQTKPLLLFFVGPSGTGKTELALAMGSALGREVLRYDMSEYQKEEDVNRLIGASKGYSGHRAGGQLTNGITMHPNAIVLFDEVEKAHRRVCELLLGLLDAGGLTDGNGRKVDCKKIIIVMTSNLKAQEIAKINWSDEPAAIDDAIKITSEAIKTDIGPEFLSHIREVIPFRPLDREMMREIMKSKVKSICNELEDRLEINILSVDERIWSDLFDQEFGADLGLRPVILHVKDRLEKCLGEQLIDEVLKKGDSVQLAWSEATNIEVSIRWPDEEEVEKAIKKHTSLREVRRREKLEAEGKRVGQRGRQEKPQQKDKEALATFVIGLVTKELAGRMAESMSQEVMQKALHEIAEGRAGGVEREEAGPPAHEGVKKRTVKAPRWLKGGNPVRAREEESLRNELGDRAEKKDKERNKGEGEKEKGNKGDL